MTFMRFHENLAAIVDFANYTFLPTSDLLGLLVCYSRDLILTFCGVENFLAVRFRLRLDFLAYLVTF